MMRTEEQLYVETDYKIIYEDDFFLAVEKPSPLPVHAVGRFKQKNLLSILQKDLNRENLRIVNRLDSETSGLVLVAKSGDAAGKLGLIFEKRQVYKEYRAVVLGVPEQGEGEIDMPLGVESKTHNIRVPDAEGQTARTDYTILSSNGEYSLLKVIPRTGRTHQIRAHMAFLGHPVAGDKIYIDPQIFERYLHEGWHEDMRPVVRTSRLLLHAAKLEFRHPETGENMKLVSEMPESFSFFLAKAGAV